MNRIRLQLVLLIIAALLLILNIYNGYIESDYNYFGIISNICLILAMSLAIIQKKKIKP